MIFDRNLLKGRRFLVIGATGGAGGATARLIANHGGSVNIMGRDPEKAEKVRRSLPVGAHGISQVIGPGQYDGVFHAAGAELVQSAGLLTPEAVERVFEPSVNIAFEIIAAAGKRDGLIKDGGALVLMSSVAAVRGTAGMTAYSASKGAIEALTLAAAVEWAPRRIRVNAIRAGGFSSPMHERLAARLPAGAMDAYAEKHPLGFGRAEDVANMAVFLLSDAGRWITGGCLPVDGGFTAR